MERNFKNHIKWQSIDEPIKLDPIKDNVLNVGQIKSIYSANITSNLLEDEDTLLQNSIEISASIFPSGDDSTSAEVNVFIEFGESPSYEIKRNGETLEKNVLSFPYTDYLTTDTVGNVTYKVQNESGNVGSVTVNHPPVETSCFVSGPNVTIELEADRGGPYDILKNGTTVEQNFNNFPYKEKVSGSGEVTYEIVNEEGYTDTCKTYPLEISTSYDAGTTTATINLDVSSAGPYTLRREDIEIASGLESGPDFPYEDNLESEGGIVEYSIENEEGNIDRSTIAIQLISS